MRSQIRSQRWLLPLLLAALLPAGCMELDNSLFNTQELERYTLPGNTIPDSLIEEVTFESEGNRLYGFWVRSNGARPGITILYNHGNKHNIDNYWDRVMYLHPLGYNIFIYDYRGFGRSAGESSESGLHADGAAALDYVLSRPDVNTDSIGYYGYSLGNVPSIWLAANKRRPIFLIAESPFASANALTQSGTGLDIPPRWLTDGTFDNVAEVKKITAPFLLLHGTDDDFVRFRDNGRVVFESAPEPKDSIIVSGAVHTDVPERMGIDVYRAAIFNWIERAIR